MRQLADTLDAMADEAAQGRGDLRGVTVASPHPAGAALVRLREEARAAREAEAGRLARDLSELANAVRAAAGNYAGLDDRLKGL